MDCGRFYHTIQNGVQFNPIEFFLKFLNIFRLQLIAGDINHKNENVSWEGLFCREIEIISLQEGEVSYGLKNFIIGDVRVASLLCLKFRWCSMGT